MKNILFKKRRKFTIESLFFFFITIFCIVFTIIFSSFNTWMICLSALLGILASKSASEGNWTTFIFDILSYIIYIFTCIKYKYYGEMILSYIVIFCHLYGIFQWKNNQDNNIVKINKIKKNEFIFFMLISLISLNIYFFILKYFNTSLALLNALSSIFFLMGNYCSYRRSVLQFVFWSFYEVCFITIWFFTITSLSPGGIIFLVDGICELVYNIIGIKKWRKLTLTQNTYTILIKSCFHTN